MKTAFVETSFPKSCGREETLRCLELDGLGPHAQLHFPVLCDRMFPLTRSHPLQSSRFNVKATNSGVSFPNSPGPRRRCGHQHKEALRANDSSRCTPTYIDFQLHAHYVETVPFYLDTISTWPFVISSVRHTPSFSWPERAAREWALRLFPLRPFKASLSRE